MAQPIKRGSHFRLNLRIKLLLVSLSILVIPWLGYTYIQEIEIYLRQDVEDDLMMEARAIASVLQAKPELIQQRLDIIGATQISEHLYLRELGTPIRLDGYLDDWRPYEEGLRQFNSNHVQESTIDKNDITLSFQHQAGIYKGYLYAIFKVNDDHIVYRNPNSLRLDQSDHLRIGIENREGEFIRYNLTTISPGWVNPHRMSQDINNPIPVANEIRIKGEWQETENGYVLEIAIPLELIGSRLSFAVADVDDQNDRSVNAVIGTTGMHNVDELGTVTIPSPALQSFLEGMEQSSSRIWILDSQRRALAISDNLSKVRNNYELRENQENTTGIIKGALQLFYQLILKQPANVFKDDLFSVSRLDSEEVNTALEGTPASQWRPTNDEDLSILSTAYPVMIEDKVAGVVVTEQDSNTILLLQNQALERLINLSLLVFLATILLLLVFSSRLTGRIRKLRDQTEMIVSDDGRLFDTDVQSDANDEIGDLSRSFTDIIERLRGYTRYLESMASKLSHEIRTPLTIVQSSLDNLDLIDLDKDARVYTDRAKEGAQRLSTILTRISEATRLEKALQDAEYENFDLAVVISGCIEGYRLAYPDQEFMYENDETPKNIKGSPDLIAQMMDKLVANAVDFSGANTPIRIQLSPNNTYYTLNVINTGPLLPDSMQSDLFDSMVSVRTEKNTEPHLGIGLYIVRLIADFHNTNVSARNLETEDGVIFTVEFPVNSNC